MKLLVRIDQTAAFKSGIDAPESTANMEVDPSELSEAIRGWITKNMVGGYRLTGISLVEPTVFALESAVQDRIEIVEKRKEERALELKNLNDYVVDGIKNGTKISTVCRLLYYKDGSVSSKNGYPVAEYTYDYFDGLEYDRLDITPATAALVQSEVDSSNARKKAAQDVVAEALLRQGRKYDNEYLALYARLNGTLKAKKERGFAADHEIWDEMRVLILADFMTVMGIEGIPVAINNRTDIDDLTNSEFTQFAKYPDRESEHSVTVATPYEINYNYHTDEASGMERFEPGIRGILFTHTRLNFVVEAFVPFA